MAGVKRALALVSIVVGGFALVGCGSGVNNPTPPVTIAGVGVTVSGSPPKPSTPAACARRWNGAANRNGRAAAKKRAPNANSALIQTAGRRGYFDHEAGRCLIWLTTSPKRAVVFVETAPGRFIFIANAAAGRFAANADLRQGGRLHLS